MFDPVQSLFSIRAWLEQRPETAVIAGIWIVVAVFYGLLTIFKIGRRRAGSHGHFRLVGYAGNLLLAIGTFAAVIYLIPRYMLESAQATVRGYAERVRLMEPYPLRWKSDRDRAIKLLRFRADRVGIETVSPATGHLTGEFTLAELHKRGDKYVGAAQNRSTCVWQDAAAGQRRKECTEELSIELTSVTPRRIEGRMQFYRTDSAFHCQTCSHSAPPVWRTFVWTPE